MGTLRRIEGRRLGCPSRFSCLGAGRARRLSYMRCYTEIMTQTITFRPDEDAERALAVLTADGTSVSAAVRTALIESARRRAEARLRQEAAALADDKVDRAEAARVLRDMETLRAW